MSHVGLNKMFRGLNTATGTWRRRWPDLYAEHSRRSMQMISSAMAGSEGRSEATILGLGCGVEFGDDGLAQMARRFRHLLVVDVDIVTAKRTVQQMPAGLRRAVDVMALDLSGNVVADFCRDAESAIEQSTSPDEAIQKAVRIVRGLQPREILSDAHADFVCSSLVMTQFGSAVQRHFSGRLTAKFGVPGVDHAAYAAFVLAASALTKRLGIEHVRNLHRWARRGGTVYFADTEREVEGTSEGSQMTQWSWQSAPMFAVDQTERIIAELFSERARDKWVWMKKRRAGGARKNLVSGYLITAYQLERLL